MKREFKGFDQIFAFTFRHQMEKKSFRSVTVSVAVLCVLIPALVMTGIEYFGGNEAESVPESGVQAEQPAEPVDLSVLKQIHVVDISRGARGLGKGKFSAEDFRAADFPMMAQYTGVDLSGVKFIDGGKDIEKVLAATRGTDDTLVLAVNLQGTEYALNLLIPEDSGVSEDVAYGAAPFFDSYVQIQTVQINGLLDPSETENENASEKDALKDGLAMLFPYVNIMLIYFFVLLYGQSVSQSVVMEKSSKLMDVFLISVKPSAMILGKMTAIGLAGIFQLFLWLASLAAGFGLGYLGVKQINPKSDMIVVQLMADFGKVTSGMFSVGGVVMALLIIFAGMLLYCALAGIGGALAGKQDDLASTNIFFTLTVVASFFACLYGGGIGGDEMQQWLHFVPFTALMVTPSAALLGTISFAKSLVSFLIILVTALVFTFLAGRIYKNMALYKGDIPKIRQIMQMLK